MYQPARYLVASLLALGGLAAQPALPYRVVPDWPQLPKGLNLGECSGVDVDRNDNVWVFHRGSKPLLQFDKSGKLLQSFDDRALRIRASHGVRVDPEGNIWVVDVKGHLVLKLNTGGRILMVLGRQDRPGENDSKDGFKEPTGLAFAPGGDFFLSDGYLNARVVKFNKAGEYVSHWGRKGTGDGEFDLVHDITIDSRGRLYVADRSNQRIQIFDQNGRFLGKWTNIPPPQGVYYAAREDVIYVSTFDHRVAKLNLDGQVLGVFGARGKTPGQFDSAHNIAVDSEGSIYVAEIRNWRVQKFARR